MSRRSSDETPEPYVLASGPLNGDPVAYCAAVRPDRVACLDLATGSRLTYADLDRRIAACTGVLLDFADAVRQRVAVLARNTVDQIVLAFACQRAGAIFVPLNWRLSAPELQALLEDCTPFILVFGREFEREALAAAAGCPRTVAVPFEGPDGFSASIDRHAPAREVPAVAADPCVILYTSGTTGRPKGVVVTRANAFFASLNFAFVGEIGASTVALSDLPLFHTIGLIAVCRTTLTTGGTLVVSNRFTPGRTLSALSDPAIGVTHYFGVPQIAAALKNDPAYAPADLSHLHAIFVGGAPLDRTLIESFLEDGIPLVNGYGMSEAGSVLHVPIDAEAVRANPGSVGLPAPLLDLRIVDAAGRDVDEGEVGELWLRGPAVTPGYWNRPAETEAAFAGGWFRTGDLARREPNGFHSLVDRLKDMFISGGENVYPAEVEAAILAHPAVADAAVVGIPDPRWGEAGLAHVVVRTGATLDEAELLRHCADRLARYKRPVRILFIDAVPRTASGKILKQHLRRAFQDQPPDLRTG